MTGKPRHQNGCSLSKNERETLPLQNVSIGVTFPDISLETLQKTHSKRSKLCYSNINKSNGSSTLIAPEKQRGIAEIPKRSTLSQLKRYQMLQ